LIREETLYSTKVNYKVFCIFIHKISCGVAKSPRWFCKCSGCMDTSYTKKTFCLTWYWLYSEEQPLQSVGQSVWVPIYKEKISHHSHKCARKGDV